MSIAILQDQPVMFRYSAAVKMVTCLHNVNSDVLKFSQWVQMHSRTEAELLREDASTDLLVQVMTTLHVQDEGNWWQTAAMLWTLFKACYLPCRIVGWAWAQVPSSLSVPPWSFFFCAQRSQLFSQDKPLGSSQWQQPLLHCSCHAWDLQMINMHADGVVHALLLHCFVL